MSFSIQSDSKIQRVDTRRRVMIKIVTLFFLIWCDVSVYANLSPLDPSSFSRPELAVVKHISISWNVDFENNVLSGSAVLSIDVLDNIKDVILDVNNLTITSIETDDGIPLNFIDDDYVTNFGSKLTITLPKQAIYGEKLNIKINYSSSPTATALNWLDPNQTSGKKYPFLFSQCLPIRARSILPCQDTPGVKFTYDAEITASEELTVLMSALRSRVDGNKTYLYQPVPLPSYLLAIVVGALEFKELGPRSKVWAEKEFVNSSAWEFAETEKYLRAAEAYCGPYEWSQYDLLVMPPSFAYGGMENPCLTYVTPSLLAGDRSLANVIIHEIIHSWTGNLVSIKNFEHFWMKEGFTVFLERKIGASLDGNADEAKKSRDFESMLGLQDLIETVNDELGPNSPFTHLVLNLTSTHFDDTYSRVPYEKGSLFLRYLEDLLGGPEFDGFVSAFIIKFRRQSINTEQLKSFMLEYFKDHIRIGSVDWNTWFYGSGMPPAIPSYDDSLAKTVATLVENLTTSNVHIDYDDIKNYSPRQMIYLLQLLIDHTPLQLELLHRIGEVYRVASSENAEIKLSTISDHLTLSTNHRRGNFAAISNGIKDSNLNQGWFFKSWYQSRHSSKLKATYGTLLDNLWIRLCIRSKDQSKLAEAFQFADKHGRMKYLRPLYRDLYAWEDVRQQAIDNFLENEKYMMEVTANAVRKDLNLNY